MRPSFTDMKGSIDEAIAWLRGALDVASMSDVEGYETGGWPAMDALAERLQASLDQLERILPLDPEIVQAIAKEWEEDDR